MMIVRVQTGLQVGFRLESVFDVLGNSRWVPCIRGMGGVCWKKPEFTEMR